MILTNELIKNEYSIKTSSKTKSSIKAVKVLKTYLTKIFSCDLPIVDEIETKRYFSVEIDESYSLEEFSYEIDRDANVKIIGGERGVIYGVYSFLEEIFNCRYFCEDLEIVPKAPVEIKTKTYSRQKSPFFFRDVLTAHTMSVEYASHGPKKEKDEFCLKLKMNSELFGLHDFGEENGYGVRFAGCPAHTLTGQFLVPEEIYAKLKPEYYALVDGERRTNIHGQICYTNPELVDVVYKHAVEWLEKDKNAKFISLSIGDNNNFCECEECKKAYEKEGKGKVILTFINKVAKKIKKSHPNVFVHTLVSYGPLLYPVEGIKMEDNVVFQFCTVFLCEGHKFTDTTCAFNQDVAKNLKGWGNICSNLLLWIYCNDFSYELLMLPDIPVLNNHLRYYAENNVKGLFFEGAHRLTHKFACFDELKSYLLLKLMWNPFMSEKEYQRHIDEFMSAFYGKGFSHLKKYIFNHNEFFNDYHINHAMSDLVGTLQGGKPSSVVIPTKGKVKRVLVQPNLQKLEKFVKESEALFDKAIEESGPEYFEKIDKERTQLMFLDLFFTMEEIMKNGDGKKRKVAINKNEKLIENIKKYNIKITFWGETIEDQMKFISESPSLPPSEWHYL